LNREGAKDAKDINHAKVLTGLLSPALAGGARVNLSGLFHVLL